MNSKQQKELNELSKTLNINLPFGNIPLPIKIIAFLTSAGGLSILANVFSDFINPSNVFLHFYLFRILVGCCMMAVGYGILKKQEWSIWLYGILSLTSLFINPVLSIIPIFVTSYLIYHHNYFTKGYMINIIEKFYHNLMLTKIPSFSEIKKRLQTWCTKQKTK